MKINYKNKDLKLSNELVPYACFECVFNSISTTSYCGLLCPPGRTIWIKDIFNSDIFNL